MMDKAIYGDFGKIKAIIGILWGFILFMSFINDKVLRHVLWRGMGE
jgi:hypothetical protein